MEVDVSTYVVNCGKSKWNGYTLSEIPVVELYDFYGWCHRARGEPAKSIYGYIKKWLTDNSMDTTEPKNKKEAEILSKRVPPNSQLFYYNIPPIDTITTPNDGWQAVVNKRTGMEAEEYKVSLLERLVSAMETIRDEQPTVRQEDTTKIKFLEQIALNTTPLTLRGGILPC